MNLKARAAYDEALKRIKAFEKKDPPEDDLDLADLGLELLPPEIGRLHWLSFLDLGQNELTSLPKELGLLRKLEVLTVNSNRISNIPEVIWNRRKLKALYLYGNPITGLPPGIGELQNLEILSLWDCPIRKLPAEVSKLRKLKHLDLDDTGLQELPVGLLKLTQLQRLHLHGNPALDLPDTVLGPSFGDVVSKSAQPASPKAILDYYFALQRGQRPLHEVKLILIGRGSVGKTSLVRALMGGKFNKKEAETPGIGIGTWLLRCGDAEIKVHVWDFAGQEITHEAHRFFLTERCVYLVVTEGRQGLQDADSDHWLAHVEQYGTQQEDGKEPQTSPALVVANKIDLSACPLERQRLKREHPCVRDFVETDCQTGKGIAALKKKIAEIIASPEMDSVRQPFPSEWQKMKGRMEDWKKLKRHFFDYEAFKAECGKQGVQTGDELALTHVLNQLGIALYYGQNPRLRDTRVLDPQWLANGLYALIRGVEKHGNKKHPGELRASEVATRLKQGLALMKGKLTLKDFPPQARTFLLELMEDRELCFVARETNDGKPIYLLPGLLPKDEPEGIDLAQYLIPQAGEVRLRFGYQLLPDGLIPRFIVRTHSLSHDLPRWRRGVFLAWHGSEEVDTEPARAVVLADLKAKRVEVAVQGGTPQLRQELAGMVRTHLKNIHEELPKALNPQEELALSTDGEHWEDVETLQLAAQQDRTLQVKVNRKFIDLPPKPELEKVEPETAWQADAEEKALRVFVSYSHMDHKHLEKLTTPYLAVLENEKLIQKWTDGEIRAGEKWDERIRDEMRNADIIILLLSEGFFASRYIQGVEMALARERHKKDEAEIIPVILSGETYKEHAWLMKLQLSPKQAGSQKLVPLLDFQPRQASGWQAVQRQLRNVIAERRKKPRSTKARVR